MKKILCFVMLASAIFGCNNDNEAPSSSIFSFNMVYNSGDDVWIVLRDNETGELIDSRQVFAGSTIDFQSSKTVPGGKLTVTVFHSTLGDTNNTVAEVFSDVAVGSKWSYNTGKGWSYPDAGASMGLYLLDITNVADLLSVHVSDEFGTVNDLDNAYIYSAGTVTITPRVNSNSKKKHIISVETKSGPPRYLVLNDVVANSKVKVDYNDFRNFESNLKVTFPKTASIYTEVIGYEQLPLNFSSFILNGVNGGAERSELNLGFLNNFQNYTVIADIGQFYFRSVGQIPRSIDYVSYTDFKISAGSFSNYSVTTSQPYEYRMVAFAYHEEVGDFKTFQASYSSPANAKYFDPISPEIAAKYSIDISKIKYENTQFMVKGRSYQEYLNSLFDIDYDFMNTPYETSTVTRLSWQ